MARRQRKDIKSEINIVPFLDVLLVLVLIFMATAPIISQSVQVELPDSVQSQNVSNEDKPLLLPNTSFINTNRKSPTVSTLPFKLYLVGCKSNSLFSNKSAIT